MNKVDTINSTVVANDTRIPTIRRKYGNKTFEVVVHFSKTSNETLTDKIMRLVHNDINSLNMQ